MPCNFSLFWILTNAWSGQTLQGSALFFRVPPFLFNASDVFAGGSIVFGKSSIVPMRSGWSAPSRFLGGLRSCCWVCYWPAHLLEISSGYSSLILPDFLGGTQSSRKDCFTIARSVTVSLLSTFYSIFPLTKKFLPGCLPYLQGYFRKYIFLHVLWGGEIE